MSLPLMPKATAVWLIENTALTFNQIADFCGMHMLEVKNIAVNSTRTMAGISPIMNGQLSKEEIARCEADENARLMLLQNDLPKVKNRARGARYTPMAKRQDKPDAVAWLLKNHPEISDSNIHKLIGTTAKTIESIRLRTHSNMAAIKPRNPVLLGLCTESDLKKMIDISTPIENNLDEK